MRGLIKKDCYLMRAMAGSYLLIFAVFAVLSLAGAYSPSFPASLCALMCIMIPVNTFSYDEMARWDGYAAALPGGRDEVVRAKYAFALLTGLGALALTVLLTLAARSLGGGRDGESLGEALVSVVVPAGAGVGMNAILLPLLFKFGAQKGRIYLGAAVGILFGVLLGGAGALSQIEGETARLLAAALAVALPLLGVFALFPSYLISRAVYRAKDL